jgi:hypothetical protein
MKLIFSTILLTTIFAFAAMAQRIDITPGTLAGRELPVSGTQTAPGLSDGSTFRGNAFMFTSADERNNYALSVSIDYVENPFEANSFDATGGSWTLTVFRGGVMIGTVYGDVVGGGINERLDENSALLERNVDVQFQAQGGTGEFESPDTRVDGLGSLIISSVGEDAAASGSLYNIL